MKDDDWRPIVSADGVRTLLAYECRGRGGQRAWAEKHGVSQAYVSAVLTGKKMLSRRLLRELRLEPIVAYVPLPSPPEDK